MRKKKKAEVGVQVGRSRIRGTYRYRLHRRTLEALDILWYRTLEALGILWYVPSQGKG